MDNNDPVVEQRASSTPVAESQASEVSTRQGVVVIEPATLAQVAGMTGAFTTP